MDKMGYILIIAVLIVVFAVMSGNSSDKKPSLKEGDKAPDFSALTDEGKKVSLADFRGKNVVLYFYPKDDTPGCTKEACSFRDSFGKIRSLGAVILGVSLDTAESHKKFREKYNLPFPLLVDKDGEISKKYNAFTQYLRTLRFSKRMTYIIDREGIIRKIYAKVDISKHSENIYNDLESIVAEEKTGEKDE